jgi:O6-methylguanine-DNA--protein-cysteine methyltransferase
MDIKFLCVADAVCYQRSAFSLQVSGIGFQHQVTNTDSGKTQTYKDIAQLIADS